MVLIKRIGSRVDDGYLITLNSSQRADTHRGTIPHAEIIGRGSGQVVRSHVGKQFRVFEPSLAEYVTLSRRLVTPVRCCLNPLLLGYIS
jgi:tRNA (adenine57-N1/adenine58-N1)-methyltransferase